MRAGDLFSGCGGLSQGFVQAGLDLVVAVENWTEAREVYKQNFDHPVLDIDISNVDKVARSLRKYKLDVLAGGPPCQDFSAAGARSEGDRAELTVSFAQLAVSLKPTWFLIENVPEIRRSSAWARSKKILKKAGYGITECTLDASYFGVPQIRKRFFAIGRLDEDDHFLESMLTKKHRSDRMTVRDYVGNEFGIDFYYRHPRNWGRRAIYSLDEPSATIRSTNRPIPPGYSPHQNDAAPIAGIRPLTPFQRARIQTFPKKFKFNGTATDRDIMIANAVPVSLAQHVGKTLLSYEALRDIVPSNRNFRKWLVKSKRFTIRSAASIVNRVRRVENLIEAPLYSTPLRTLRSLRGLDAFSKLTPNVKLQIKRAIELKHEFDCLTNASIRPHASKRHKARHR